MFKGNNIFIVNFEHVIAEKFSGIFKDMKLGIGKKWIEAIEQKWVETIEHTQRMVYITYCCSCYSVKSS